MPHELKLDFLPAGYSLSNARPGENANIVGREFTSSEDGDLFLSRSEGLPDSLLRVSTLAIAPSQVDHMIAIIRPDRSVTLFVNECAICAK